MHGISMFWFAEMRAKSKATFTCFLLALIIGVLEMGNTGVVCTSEQQFKIVTGFRFGFHAAYVMINPPSPWYDGYMKCRQNNMTMLSASTLRKIYDGVRSLNITNPYWLNGFEVKGQTTNRFFVFEPQPYTEKAYVRCVSGTSLDDINEYFNFDQANTICRNRSSGSHMEFLSVTHANFDEIRWEIRYFPFWIQAIEVGTFLNSENLSVYCSVMNNYDGMWEKDYCSKNYTSLCVNETVHDTIVYPGLVSNRPLYEKPIPCDPPWELVHRACLRFNTTNYRSWMEAREECKAIDADLLVLNDGVGFSAYRDKLSSKLLLRWWVGLKKRSENVNWIWVDGYAYRGLPSWAQGEPNGINSTSTTEDCVIVDYQTNIRDEDCRKSFPYICERNSPTTTTTTISTSTATVSPRPSTNSPTTTTTTISTSTATAKEDANKSSTIIWVGTTIGLCLLLVCVIIACVCLKRKRWKKTRNTCQNHEIVQPSNVHQESRAYSDVHYDAVPDDITERIVKINTSIQVQKNDVELGSDSPWEVCSAYAEVSVNDGPGQTNTDSDDL